jgi:hypothetical protein
LPEQPAPAPQRQIPTVLSHHSAALQQTAPHFGAPPPQPLPGLGGQLGGGGAVLEVQTPPTQPTGCACTQATPGQGWVVRQFTQYWRHSAWYSAAALLLSGWIAHGAQ